MLKSRCESCGTESRSPVATAKVFCQCGATRTPQWEIAQAQSKPPPKTSHWLELHEIARQPSWSSKKRFSEWRSRIPSFGCNCANHFSQMLERLPPDYTSQEAFARRAWEWHDNVSFRVGNPRISWEECEALFGHPWRKNTPKQRKCVTAISWKPNHLERQTVALDSWLDFGFEIYAMNTSDEVAEMREKYPQVHHWIEQNEVSTAYNYPTQLIRNLASLATEIDDEVFLINSDIEAYGTPDLLASQGQLLGVRWNYQKGQHRALAKQFQWGIDLASFTPETAAAIPKDAPYAIGQPMWDYAIPYFTMQAGIPIEFLNDRILFHEDHKTNWNEKFWYYGAKWLADTTGFSMNDYKASAEYRESLQAHEYYSEQRGMYLSRTNSKPSRHTTRPKQWARAAADRDLHVPENWQQPAS